MIRNYIKIAWRNLRRHKAYAAINVVGLSLGIACGILIFTLVNYHLNFDNFHPYKDRIYRLVTDFHGEEVGHTQGVPSPLGKAFRNDFTFAEKVARVKKDGDILISIPSDGPLKKFKEESGIAFAEPEFFEIMDFPLVQGDKKSALVEMNSAVISDKLAKKYFGNEPAIGKLIKIDNRIDVRITGILKDIPPNTDRNQEIYISYNTLRQYSRWLASDSSWGGVNSEMQCFLRLKPGVNKAAVENALVGTVKKYYTGRDVNVWRFKMQPLSDIHFNNDYDGNTDKKYLWALGFVGIFLIVTACVNFVNLATAQALNRSKEVGVRKVLGSLPRQLFWQFIAETFLIAAFAMVVAYGLAELTLPWLNQLFQSRMSINILRDVELATFLALLLAMVVFLSGSYPGLVLARFQPVVALKGKLNQKHIGGFSLRRILVVTQFAISQMLIIGTIVIASQMRYAQTADLGFDRKAIVVIPIPMNDKVKMSTLRTRLSEISGVEKISLCYQPPAANSNNTTGVRFNNSDKEENWGINVKDGDDQFLSTFGIQLVAGRNLYPSDTMREYLVNEAFVKKYPTLKPQDVIGKNLTINGDRTAQIVGVMKDFHNYSFRENIYPIVVSTNVEQYRNCAIKINMKSARSLLPAMEKIWNETYPEYLYNYEFLDERIGKFYEMDNIMLKLIEGFSLIAILIGCLGLYGLVSFMALRKTKEIGVRKVLGAGVGSILWMFGKEFSQLLVIAFAIAAPIAWWVMKKYLQDFKFQIPIGAGIFLIAILVTFMIAALTVGYRSMQSALANPVKSIRTE